MRRCGRVLVVLAALAHVLAGPAVSVRAELPVPVVLVPGWHGNPASFDAMIPTLEAAGLTVLDFDPDRPGRQALGYGPTADGQHIPEVAADVVEPAIEAALARAGYRPGAPVDIVAYSMGGLVARWLIEHPGGDVAPGWADRVGTLVMLGTPNHGTMAAWVPGTIGGFGRWNAMGGDMRPGSAFLRMMGRAEPPGERYVAVGGAPPWLPVPRHDYDGDGRAHGYDGLVPSESPFLGGDEHYLVPAHHGALPRDPQTLGLVTAALGYRPPAPAPGDGAANLAGSATIRLEYAEIADDHDRWTSDENRFAVSVDPDGGADAFVPLGEIDFRRDAPFTQNWGDGGPTAGPVRLPGTSPRLDVRLDVSEADPWGRQVVATAVFRDVMLSDDVDGMDYYEATVPLSGGRRHAFRISLNGVSALTPR